MALGSYERGDRAISARKLLEISRMYGVPVSELFLHLRKRYQVIQPPLICAN
jgi:transcriptional regulator with XRE-family HTH domain